MAFSNSVCSRQEIAEQASRKLGDSGCMNDLESALFHQPLQPCRGRADKKFASSSKEFCHMIGVCCSMDHGDSMLQHQ